MIHKFSLCQTIRIFPNHIYHQLQHWRGLNVIISCLFSFIQPFNNVVYFRICNLLRHCRYHLFHSLYFVIIFGILVNEVWMFPKRRHTTYKQCVYSVNKMWLAVWQASVFRKWLPAYVPRGVFVIHWVFVGVFHQNI